MKEGRREWKQKYRDEEKEGGKEGDREGVQKERGKERRMFKGCKGAQEHVFGSGGRGERKAMMVKEMTWRLHY